MNIDTWVALVPPIVNLGALVTVWWRLDSKMEKRLGQVETKFETVNQTLLTLSHDVGELKGQVNSLAGQVNAMPGQFATLARQA